MTAAESLAGYAADLSYGDLSEEAIGAAKTRIVDSLACALAAFPEGTVERVREYGLRKGDDGREAAVIGTDRTAAPEYAALANGTAVRYLDWNDTGLVDEGVGCGHPSDNLAAVLSAADAADRSGRDVLLATALAYEVHYRLCEAVPLRPSGLDSVNYVVAASALSAGTLLGLSEAELAEAVSIGLAGHLGLYQSRAGELSDWKGIAAANAARNGVVAAELAGEGVTGPSPIFEGTYGLFNLLGEEHAVDVGAFAPGGRFAVEGTFMKVYPVETHTQAALECVFDLLDEGVDPGGIERIESQTYGSAVGEIGDPEKWAPETRETADHSLPYIVARAFLDGEMGLDQFAPEKIRDPEVRGLMERITVEENPAFTEAYSGRMPHHMTVVTGDGCYERQVDHPKGHPENPFTGADLRRKFRAAAGDRLGGGRIDEVVAWVDDIERKESMEGLYELLAG